MKHLNNTNIFTTIAAVGFFAASLTVNAGTLKVVVDGYDSTEGSTLLNIFSSQATYEANQAAASGMASSSEGRATITLNGLPDGLYAIKLFHDENGNEKLDTNMLGIPKEQYGFSNNGGHFGPASFSDAKFEIKGDTQIGITLR
ncbi:DUF2141 domain-containing protein [Teredinibacter franksiae]|uniref:DUF2141 domain-containing protein n=1 Tax=Teredinibacter franksiae TaxID=2761453 RepID=UPI0016288331|nr:DUF2141 domain-containing protein [Teredinibacter franksiae]